MKRFTLLLLSLLPLAGQAQVKTPTARPRQLAKPTSVAAATPLSLQEAIAEALQHNFGILLSRQDANIAGNNVTRGNAGQLPSLTGNLTRTFNNNNINQKFGENDPRIVNGATSNAFNTNVTLGWTIFDGLGMFIAYDRLKTLREQQQQITRATVEETVEDVTNAYYDVVRQAGKITSLEAALKIGQARIDLTKAQVDVGVSAKVEVLTAQVDYNADRSQFLQQQQALAAAKITLNNLMGRSPRLDFSPSDSLTVSRDLREDAVVEGIKTRNPRLAQARLGTDVATYDRKLVRASRFPRIGLVSGYGLTRNINNAAFAGTVLTSSTNQVQGLNYGVTASVPIFNGFNLRRQEQNARVVEEQSQLSLSQTSLQLDADAATAFAQYQNYLQLLELEEANIQLARQNVDIALERYRLGLLTPLALREAQRNELDAETRLLDIRYAAKQAETQLRRLSGDLVQGQ
ncbi:TolC family protein [Hymenobacter sp. BT770]|uniref:TolC family protein n=1 Tax=Hymenobacter sp. BT770 TaxID=2886942 RepID=UPI001D1256A9|nr:TolC family protein [Hymenobacter sp. BT770]MCC3151966.1 TolC family protein [Hymenobacter sp. BT770]MDO3417076.1 TolC family protein [Hymenobacter sp. BT770]